MKTVREQGSWQPRESGGPGWELMRTPLGVSSSQGNQGNAKGEDWGGTLEVGKERDRYQTTAWGGRGEGVRKGQS